jgi:hypothetical protein
MKRVALVAVLVVLVDGLLAGQQAPPQAQPAQQAPQMQQPAQAPRLPASPRGLAATQVGGKWIEQNGETRYTDGKWITIDYGRPILRGRTKIFGTRAPAAVSGTKDNAGAPKAATGKAAVPRYGEKVNDGAPVWRAGANQTTRLKAEVPLIIGGKPLAAGEYSVFADLDNGKWTLILATQPFQQKYDPNNKTETWGSYNYDPTFDVLRVPMTVRAGTDSVEQFTIQFVNVSDAGGTIQMLWEKTVASVPFKVGQ